jgi:VIT1/CCC1 family predicted Fe2+/Mn2+ transporter
MALRTHAREELGVDPSTTGSPWGAAISSLIFCCLGALIPLLPWIVTTNGDPVVWSIGLAVLSAGVVGGVIGWFTRNGVFKWALRQIMVGALAAAVTYGIGRLVGYH